MKTGRAEDKHVSGSMSRRTFLSRSAAGALGCVLGNRLIAGYPEHTVPAPLPAKSRVISVRHPGVVDKSGKIERALLRKMLDKAMTRLTGKNTLSDAWKEFFVPEDVVGLKVNGNSLSALRNTDYIDHYPALTSAITDGLESIGIRSGNIVIYERSEEELAYARLTPQKETDAVRVLGTRAARRSSGGIGYSKQSWPVGEDASHVTRIVTDICTALINIPVLKDHRLSGITGCMKNHYGSIDNPRTFHGNSCTGPGIAEVNAIPVIREKQRLIIANALFCVYDGGPRWSPNRFWPHGRILVGTDPVAMDTVLLHILDTKRQSEGLSPVASRSLHLAEAEKLGLGVSAMERIDLIDLELG